MTLFFQLLLGASGKPDRAIHGLALLLTYLIHAALWTAAAAAFTRRRSLSSSMQHLSWKTALLAPLVTAAFVTAWPGGYAAVSKNIPHVREIAVPSFGDVTPSTVVDGEAVAITAAADVASSIWRWRPGQRLNLLLVCGGGASALGLLRFAGSCLLLALRLRGRKRVRNPRLLQRLEHMRARTALGPVVLTESASIDSPMIVGAGLGAPEICLPRTLPVDLTDAQLDTVFAHELAHLERGDGFWFPIIGFVQSVLWLQPLNHAVVFRIRHTAELACDDRAVALTADPMSLARALTEVAAGALHQHRQHRRLPLPTMAGSGGTLRWRVQRLVDAAGRGPDGAERVQSQVSAGGQAWTLMGLAVVGIAAIGLGVQPAQARPSPSPPDWEAASRRMNELVEREHVLQSRLEMALRVAATERAGTAATTLVLDLRQELRHVRLTEAWTERLFVDECTKWERRDAVAARAPAPWSP